MPNRVARLLAVLAVQPRYLPSKIPFVRRRDFCATNIRRGEERASAEASALEVSGKGQCDANNMDETDERQVSRNVRYWHLADRNADDEPLDGKTPANTVMQKMLDQIYAVFP
jgi:Ni,Fe-hydrogenase I large subunit